MLLTTPLVVTVGLSLNIPLSLVGEMIQYGQYSSFVYWIGAAVVFVSFVFVSNESGEHDNQSKKQTDAESGQPLGTATGTEVTAPSRSVS
jgi:solute carrier family 35 protein F5